MSDVTIAREMAIGEAVEACFAAAYVTVGDVQRIREADDAAIRTAGGVILDAEQVARVRVLIRAAAEHHSAEGAPERWCQACGALRDYELLAAFGVAEPLP